MKPYNYRSEKYLLLQNKYIFIMNIYEILTLR